MSTPPNQPTLSQQAKFYDIYWNSSKPYGNRKIERIIKLMEFLTNIRKIIPDPKIVDLGCGDGRSVSVWNLFGTASGFDLSEKAMEKATKAFPSFKFFSGDATATNFESESFDIVISQEVIEHIEDQSKYIAECARITRKNGYLLITTPNKYYFDRFSKGNYSKQPIENIIDHKQLKEVLNSEYHILITESVVAGNADRGIYKIITNRYVIAFLRKLRLDFVRINFINKKLLGVHLCVLARKK